MLIGVYFLWALLLLSHILVLGHTCIFPCVDRAEVYYPGRKIKSTIAFVHQFDSDYLSVQVHQSDVLF